MIVIDRALSVLQPWATLVTSGLKLVETRSWSTNFRGWVAIHASNGFPARCRALLSQPQFAPHLEARPMPFGVILAVAEVYGCRRVECVQVSDLERGFGDYSAGRYAIFLRSVRPLREPVPVKGALRIWRLPHPVVEGALLPALEPSLPGE